MKAKTIVENNHVSITTECTVSEFFAIQTAIRIALKAKILPDDDRQILEEIIKVKPKLFEEVKQNELDKLEKYLKEHGYVYERIDVEKGYINTHQIRVYKDGKMLWDAICHMGSYGYERGLLEVMGVALIGHDDVEGFLTAQDVIDKLEDKK